MAYALEVADTELRVDVRPYLRGAMLALLLSSNSVLVLCFGIVGLQGNSLFTGSVLAAVTASIFLLSDRHFAARPADYLFGLLVLCVVASFALNARSAPAKEIALLILSLAAYPACRCLRARPLDDVIEAFIWVTGFIIAAGTIATVPALFQQWNDPHGKPLVFGMFAAATINSLTTLGFFVMAVVTRGLTARTTRATSVFLFLPCAIFSASLVRFTFAAIVTTLFAALALASAGQRIYIAAVILVITSGIGAGQIARHEKATILLSHLTAISPARSIAVPPAGAIETTAAPSCSLDVDSANNSVATRKALLRDAIALIPAAGLTGLGLDGFMNFS
jgi:hypothetical protein